jgi:hypothetical protein
MKTAEVKIVKELTAKESHSKLVGMLSLLKIPYLRLKYKFLPNEAQAFWAQELLDGTGLTAKIGQVLGQGRKTALPKSSLSPQEAQRLFAQAFGKDIQIEGEGLAASMGQVFFFEKNALKILHPGIKEKLQKEIKNILVLGHYFSKTKGFHFDQAVFRRFLNDVFAEETDLIREAHYQRQFFKIFKDDPRILIPEVRGEFSNADLLTQERIECTLARDAKTLSHYFIFDFFFHSLLDFGLLHGDLNDRNWGLVGDEKIVVYDYGCSQHISERRVEGLKKLIMNIDVVNAFQEFGVRLEATPFKGEEQTLRENLFRTLMGHIGPKWSYSEELQAIYGDKIKALREFTDPWVLLFMRSFFSLIRLYQERGISIPMQDLIRPYLKLKGSLMEKHSIKIEVTEGLEQVVYLELPLTALATLEEQLPSKVLKKIQEANIDLPSIIQRAMASQGTPQELFSLNADSRYYRVWIS